MGLFFTIVYIVTAFITPTAIFGSLAEYHIEVLLALFTLFFSLFTASGSRTLSIPQTYAIFGTTVAVALSILFAGLGGEVIGALLEFIPGAAAFFFVFWNCKTKRHLRLLVAVLLACALFVVYQGYVAQASSNTQSMYIIPMHNSSGALFFRIRGLGFINDPNDFAQFVAGLIPCVFFFWRKGRVIANFAFIYVPITILIYGMYLTHSRGGMIALMAAAIVAGRKKIGILPALVGGIIVFAVLSAVGWSGGRDVSAAAGADRTEAWATGLTLIRSHPIFGVGYLRFSEYFYITAHNTVVVCAAEIGLIGFFCWVVLIFTSLHDLVDLSAIPSKEHLKQSVTETQETKGFERFPRLATVSVLRTPEAAYPSMRGPRSPGAPYYPEESRLDIKPPDAGSSPLPQEDGSGSDDDLRRMGHLLIISFTGFLAAGWFLSRAYTMPLFLLAGMAAVLYRIGRGHGMTRPAITIGRTMAFSAGISAALILIVYVGLRLEKFFPS